MKLKYIVVKGDAKNHLNNVDRLDNTCNIVESYQDAMRDAAYFLDTGSLVSQIYILDTELRVEDIVKETNDGKKCNLKLKDYIE